jgi:hypothetical protein
VRSRKKCTACETLPGEVQQIRDRVSAQDAILAALTAQVQDIAAGRPQGAAAEVRVSADPAQVTAEVKRQLGERP